MQALKSIIAAVKALFNKRSYVIDGHKAHIDDDGYVVYHEQQDFVDEPFESRCVKCNKPFGTCNCEYPF